MRNREREEDSQNGDKMDGDSGGRFNLNGTMRRMMMMRRSRRSPMMSFADEEEERDKTGHRRTIGPR